LQISVMTEGNRLTLYGWVVLGRSTIGFLAACGEKQKSGQKEGEEARHTIDVNRAGLHSNSIL
jgi:hypothetical protein